ncbi:hybrid sensor histidine kinase/response regulator [Sediminibacterium ginsengisoli]|uniref:Oxygen sensor histidine kinase NreB n=1 Tax=Sediminibacterium ginsengisoli TaxID=413434 RepID=A0A1T4RH40_9BACT|nr:PAS domain S-box protein [Sediminibacterium ginsengisoli]SKA15126.1 PAS domain S-box-containing protein [Sediminibacterium ginsengisoli]
MSDTQQPLSILIVEDNPGDMFLLEEWIRASALSVNKLYKVTNTAQAVTVLQLQEINLVLLDLSLPDSDGLQSYHLISQYAESIPVIVLTGLIDMEMALETMASGAQDYLIKGEFDEKLLYKSIQYSIERKRNQETLLESNERYRFAIRATTDVIWDWNMDTNELYWGAETMNAMFGYILPDSITPIGFWEDRIHPEDKERVLRSIYAAIHDETQTQWREEYRFRKADGTYAYIQDKGYMLYKGATVTRMIGAMQDITERKLAEIKLRNSEERFRNLFFDNPMAIYIWDVHTMRIHEVNGTAEKEYGYSREEFLNMTVLDIRPPEEVHMIMEYARRAKMGIENRLEGIWRHRKKNGELMYMEIFAHQIEFNGGQVIMTIANNVTEKVKLEKKLQEERMLKQKEITEAVIRVQEKERYEISKELHDNVNQQLTVAMMYIATAQKGGDNHQELLRQSSGFIFNGIEEIRKLSKALVTPLIKDFGLAKAIDGLVEDILLANESMTIDFFADAFYEEDINYEFKLNIFRIVQEQMNNIIKHAQASHITIELYRQKNITLSIQDNGKGFNPAEKRKGIGLNNIVSRAELYGGTIELKTSPGQGCRLHIAFPATSDMIGETM